MPGGKLDTHKPRFKCLNAIIERFSQPPSFAVSHFGRRESNNEPPASRQGCRRWQRSPGACAFHGTSLPLPLFHFISQRELVRRFKEVKGELKCSKNHWGTSFQLRSVTPLWSAGHPAGCVSRLLLSPRLVPAPQEVARLPRLSSEQRDGAAAWWPACGTRRWSVPFWWLLLIPGHESPGMGSYQHTRASMQALVRDSPLCSLPITQCCLSQSLT